MRVAIHWCVASVLLTMIAVGTAAARDVRKVGSPASTKDPGTYSGGEPEFGPVEAQTRKFIEYNRTIRLTPAQQSVKDEALSELKAVCCDDFPASTCCCPCNFSKSLWGMANHLIADEGHDSAQVRNAAKLWVAYVNPSGFSGDVCKAGGCDLPFARNGCGGMDENDIQF
ncbi:MAG: hypothetical protein HYU52_14190 [Acidobacteria bacterium]|nr:hypothetical protein [Acidobacteriota bacterium]